MMYDLSSLTISGNFETALNARPKNLATMSCSAGSAPENERFQYDTSDGLDTIVNQVSSLISKFGLSKTNMIFSGIWFVIAFLCFQPFKAVTWVEFLLVV